MLRLRTVASTVFRCVRRLKLVVVAETYGSRDRRRACLAAAPALFTKCVAYVLEAGTKRGKGTSSSFPSMSIMACYAYICSHMI